MNTEPTNVEKIRGLRWSIAGYSANSVFVQLTLLGSVFVLFLSELGLSKTEIGSILSLIPLSGAVALFVAPAVARFGYKRTFLAFFGLRKVFAAFLLLTPWILTHWGSQATRLYVVGIVAIFSLSRSVSLTAVYPWTQEYVPNTVRGKYAATEKIFTSLTGFLSITVAGYVIGPSPDLSRFMVLYAVGLLFGLIAVWAFSFIPGGASTQGTTAKRTSHRDLIQATRDKNLLRYLAGTGLMTLAATPLASFVPLFMQEQVGLNAGQVVWLQIGTLLATLLSSYLWGWAADRYGSKPVMLSGVALRVILPLCWLLMPRQTAWSLPVALGVAFLQGVSAMGWGIGATRLLFVSVVPPEKKTEYMALYYAWVGIVGGLGQMIGGRALDFAAGITGRFLIFTLDPYTILFVAGLALPVVGGALLRGVRADSTVGVGAFASMFLRGNPVRAMRSLIRYHRAKDERTAVSMTESLGETESPLTVEELLEALADPRFYVRFEAIVSIARRGPDARLTEALTRVLEGSEPALSVIAAWALGRIGDERAIEALRAGLDAPYRSVQAHCARSLGSLSDTAIAPRLLERLAQETDVGLRIAYASALGKLGVKEAAGQVLIFLRTSQDASAQGELALALARMVGDEHYFVQLLRRVRAEAGTATSQAVSALKKRMDEAQMDGDELMEAMDDCAGALARGELADGTALMSQVIGLLPVEGVDESCAMILRECAERLEEFRAGRIEYVLLALHTLHACRWVV